MNGQDRLKKLAKKYGVPIPPENGSWLDTVGGLLFELDAEITELKSNVKKPRITKTKTEGSLLWDLYSRKYQELYNTEPIRNGMTNRICSQLFSRLGLDMATEVIVFYLKQRDSFYIKNAHHLRFCLQDCETLATKMKTGLSLTNKQAKKVETASHNANITQQYLKEKRGERT